MGSEADLQQIMQVVEPRVKRHRPLARACPQLLLDTAAWLSGLKAVVMLDHAPGATPQHLQQALQPLAELLPQFKCCILQLEGCCYLANSRLLLHRLAALATAGPSNSSSWPAVLSFSEGQLTLAPPEQCQELQQQVRTLSAGMQSLLYMQQQEEPGAGSATQGCVSRVAQHRRCNMPVVDLGRIQGLPAMPTLNGFLLGYPTVYWVKSPEEAAVASRQLSLAQLRLHKVLAAVPLGSAGSSAGAILSFTMPESLCDAGFECKVQQLMQCMKEAAEGGVRGNALVGIARLPEGQRWEVRLQVEAAEICGVSL